MPTLYRDIKGGRQPMDDAQKERIREALKVYWADPKHKEEARQRATRQWTPEQKQEMSERMKAVWTPEKRKEASERAKARTAKPEPKKRTRKAS